MNPKKKKRERKRGGPMEKHGESKAAGGASDGQR